jgi:cobalamin synthase
MTNSWDDNTEKLLNDMKQRRREQTVHTAEMVGTLIVANYVISRWQQTYRFRKAVLAQMPPGPARSEAVKARRDGAWLHVLAGLLVLLAFPLAATGVVLYVLALAFLAVVAASACQARGNGIISRAANQMQQQQQP